MGLKFFPIQLTNLAPQSQKTSGETGESMLALIISMGLFGLLAVGISQMSVQGYKANKSVELRQGLEVVRETIRSRMDCRKSLGIAAGAPLPLSCASSIDRELKGSDGRDLGSGGGKIGVWTVKGSCQGNELIIRASADQLLDPINGQKIDAMLSNSIGTKVSEDLFGGTSDFCREYYEESVDSCGGDYPSYQGTFGGSPLCCRKQGSDVQASYLYGTRSTCRPNEWILRGWGACDISGPPNHDWWENPAFLHADIIEGNAALTDCYPSNPAGPMPTGDSASSAGAVCCPAIY